MRTFTIGFTEKSAEQFFALIKGQPQIQRVVDVRLHPDSQLSAFAKRRDLKYFLKNLVDVDYHYEPLLAPTKDIFTTYKNRGGEWAVFEQAFLGLLKERRVEKRISKELIEDACLLCSEHKPHHCHRRLVVDYLNEHWSSNLEVRHL